MRHVRHLVAEDRGQLRLVVEPREESRVDEDRPVGQREGIQRGIAQDVELEAGAAGRSDLRRRQPVPDPGQVVREEGIVQDPGRFLDGLGFLLGLAPEALLVRLGPERFPTETHRGDVPARATWQEDRRDEQAGEKLLWAASGGAVPYGHGTH